jgi:hypothetical protein
MKYWSQKIVCFILKRVMNVTISAVYLRYLLVKKTLPVLLLLTSVFLFSCKHTPVIPESPAVSFQTDVLPTISGNCTASGCHGTSGSRRLQLMNYPDVMGTVSAGDAQNSKLYNVISGKGFNSIMPPKSSGQASLTENQITTIYLWIMQGAKNN